MGKLIIDGNSIFEIDEDCVKKKKLSKECDLEKYLSKQDKATNRKRKKEATE